jgi:hypothetical protein
MLPRILQVILRDKPLYISTLHPCIHDFTTTTAAFLQTSTLHSDRLQGLQVFVWSVRDHVRNAELPHTSGW